MNKSLLTLMSFSLLITAAGCTPAEISGIIRDVASSQPSASPSNTSAAAPVASAELKAFQTRFQEQAKTPRGAARMLFEALVNGAQKPDQAETFLTVVLRSDELETAEKSPTGYSLSATGKFMLQQFQARPEIIYSYIGGTPDKDYKNWNQSTLQISVPEQGASAGQIVIDNSAEKSGASTGKLYVTSSGRDTPVPVNMDLNRDGVWKIQTSSLGNLAAGVKPGTANAGNF